MLELNSVQEIEKSNMLNATDAKPTEQKAFDEGNMVAFYG